MQVGQGSCHLFVLRGVESAQVVKSETGAFRQDALFDCFQYTSLPKCFESTVAVLVVVSGREDVAAIEFADFFQPGYLLLFILITTQAKVADFDCLS